MDRPTKIGKRTKPTIVGVKDEHFLTSDERTDILHHLLNANLKDGSVADIETKKLYNRVFYLPTQEEINRDWHHKIHNEGG